ncbi:efflux pump membrane transporter BepE [Caedimonas varicaedens]|uniref:Efflux pump membrane transporter BepE n=1 Tax=Caedimonas varicaedens TaxID=1629334 RepID=A0A0K8ME19_9PROT|nr:efflux pump membrane transporter BepE [Caedimonas varicaedens]
MKLTNICIKRPVLSTVMSLVIILLGIVTWGRLQVRQYPNVDEPRISIVTQLEGASPEIIEAQITKPMEDVLNGIEGLYEMNSSSEVGESRINLTFNLKRNIEDAANDVRNLISRIRDRLPNDISEPRIKKADADAAAFMQLALYSDRYNVKELADYAHRYLESQLEVLNGVSSVDVVGGGQYEMQIYLDPVKLVAYNVTAEDVAQALKKQNIKKAAGRLISSSQEITVTTRAPLVTEKDFNNLIVYEREGSLVRLSDVGRAKLDSIDTRNRVRFNGRPAVSIALVKQSTANPLEIGEQVKKTLVNIKSALPNDMNLEIAVDRTLFIDRSISQVYRTLLEATILVVLVILAFLRSFRAVLIPVVTIPVSLIGTFALMYFFGFTINTLTLLALVLAIGLVVDDAIVMLENIYRHIEEGMKPMEAAFKGAREISFAILAMTITLAAVYAPIALSSGQTGKLFTEFALTLAGSVLISGFVALTLSPMMCGRLLIAHKKADEVHREKEGWRKKFDLFELACEQFLKSVEEKYGAFLHKCLTQKFSFSRYSFSIRNLVLFLGLAVAFGAYLTYQNIPTELVPKEDQGIVLVQGIPPYGANLEYVDKYVKKIDEILKRDAPEIVKKLSTSSVPGESFSFCVLKPWEDRKRRSQEIVEALREPLYEITGMNANPSVGGKSLVGGLTDKPFDIILQTTKSYPELVQMAEKLEKALHDMGMLQGLYSNYGSEGQELVVHVDRDKAASLGVDVSVIADTLDTLISGRSPTKFERDSKLYSAKLWVEEEYRRNPEDVVGLYVRGIKNKTESMVPLSELITVEKKQAPTAIAHYGGLKSVNFSAKLKEGVSLGKALETIQEKIFDVLPKADARLEFTGESRRYLEESSNILLIFGLALAFIYLVLSAQYESYVDPLIILFSVPLSLAGGIYLLKLSGQTMNLYSEIGLVTLIGLITKHGILIVDFANKLKADGLDRVEAVVEASRLRLRPILMTTFAMVLGAFPLAFTSGAGAESRRPIGIVIVGGMTLGTIFTLFIVPAIYTYLSRKRAAADLTGFNTSKQEEEFWEK